MNCKVPDHDSSLRTVLTAGMLAGRRLRRLLSSDIRVQSQPATGNTTA